MGTGFFWAAEAGMRSIKKWRRALKTLDSVSRVVWARTVAGKGEARLRRAWKTEEQEDPAKGLRLGPTSLFISLHVYREPSFYKALSQKKEKLHQETFPLIWWNAQSLLQRRKHTTHKQPWILQKPKSWHTAAASHQYLWFCPSGQKIHSPRGTKGQIQKGP